MINPMYMETETAKWQKLKEEIKAAGPSLGIDKIGFASADPFLELKERLIKHRADGRQSGFEEPDIEKRVRPDLIFDGPRSIISIAIAYPSKLNDPPKSEPGAYRGIISRASWGEDYHLVLRERMRRLEAFILERAPEARLESMVDTGALSDRAVAERAGIGWSGKNCAIITPEWGSWVYLGEMLTDIPFEPDQPVTEDCGDCTACIDACPTGALVGPGQIDAKRCLSFVTQTKDFVSDELKVKVGNRVYGCDTCQVVCPKNKKKNWTHQLELQPDPELMKPLLKPLMALSNKQYKGLYGNNASSWRGKKPIQRNAVIAMGNFKDRSSIGLLTDLLKDDRPIIREAAAWSLGRIGGPEAELALRSVLDKEEQPEVLKGIEHALEKVLDTTSK